MTVRNVGDYLTINIASRPKRLESSATPLSENETSFEADCPISRFNNQFHIITNIILLISMFHRAFFNSIIDKHQHMHFFTFKTVLV